MVVASAKQWYNSKRWKVLRKQVLSEEPLCRLCKEQNKITAATVVDHKEPHRGDETLMWDRKNLQPSCKSCHDKKTSRFDNGSAFGAGQVVPTWVKPPQCAVTLICGPDGSGRDIYADQFRTGQDTVISLSRVIAELSNQPRYQSKFSDWHAQALYARNAQLQHLSTTRHRINRAFVILAAPRLNERNKWRTLLKADKTVVLEVEIDDCLNHLARTNRPHKNEYGARSTQWWRKYTTAISGDEYIIRRHPANSRKGSISH